ncbi:MAG: hypothetical protein ACFFCQ_06300 [Promethearchaeota archaeon]
MKSEHEKAHDTDCECDKPDIRASYKGKCPKEQIVTCHGKEFSENMKKNS